MSDDRAVYLRDPDDPLGPEERYGLVVFRDVYGDTVADGGLQFKRTSHEVQASGVITAGQSAPRGPARSLEFRFDGLPFRVGDRVRVRVTITVDPA